LFPNDPKYGGKLTVSALRVNGSAVEPALEVDDTAMRVTLDPPLQPGDAANFEMHYTTEVPTRRGAFGFSEFGFYSNTLALPGFYPLIPAYDDEGWHIEPAPLYGDAIYSASALYQVNITAPANQVVATSGVCDAQAAGDGTTKTWRCVSGPMRDFMIAMSADYRIESATVGGIQINSYYWEKDAGGGRKLLETAVSSVESFERRIGAYPFNELDIVETPTNAGGIEYPGLVVFAALGYRGEMDAFHEVAHQWWYSLVGNDPVNEPWLDEALAGFMTILGLYDDSNPERAELFIGISQQRYSSIKGTPDDRPANLPVASYASARQHLIAVYFKGALFFNALYKEMGDEKFNAFLKTYFDAHRYGIVDAEDLLQAMETQLDRATIDELLEQWITTP
jgi:aminopeptidase N